MNIGNINENTAVIKIVVGVLRYSVSSPYLEKQMDASSYPRMLKWPERKSEN
jgi:hypothetical protein